jgi:hypothetical protein
MTSYNTTGILTRLAKSNKVESYKIEGDWRVRWRVKERSFVGSDADV